MIAARAIEVPEHQLVGKIVVVRGAVRVLGGELIERPIAPIERGQPAERGGVVGMAVQRSLVAGHHAPASNGERVTCPIGARRQGRRSDEERERERDGGARRRSTLRRESGVYW